MPHIVISQASRLSPEKKEAVLSKVTAAYAEATGTDPAKVSVVLQEVDRSDWAVAGQSLASRDAAARGD